MARAEGGMGVGLLYGGDNSGIVAERRYTLARENGLTLLEIIEG